MLVMIVIFIDASFHLFGTEIYRYQRQLVVRSFLRGTPDGVGFSSCQSQYGMMTWSNSSPLLLWMVMSRDALDAVTMDAFFVEIVFPFLEENASMSLLLSVRKEFNLS